MAKVLIVNIPMHGHVNPTLAITKELVKRGHEVTYVIGESFKDKISQTGAKVVSYKIKEENLKEGALDSISDIFDKVVEIGKEYDCLIYEYGFLLGKLFEKELGIKTICLSTTMVFGETVKKKYGKNNDAFKEKLIQAISPRYKDNEMTIEEIDECINSYPNLTIVLTAKEFQINIEEFDGDKFKFIGPVIEERERNHEIPFDVMKKGIVYISLGTLSSSKKFFKVCIEAFRDKEFSVIMSIGKDINMEELGEIPDNFFIYPFVPQIEVLKHASLFISHGGMNSVNEAIFFGVPTIVVPQRADQPIVAQRVKELGVGEIIDNNMFNTDNLIVEVEKIINNSCYKVNVDNMSMKMKAAGGYKRAVDEVEKYIIK